MKIFQHTWLLFVIPVFADIAINNVDNEFNKTLVIIAISASLIGSSARASINNEVSSLKLKNYLAIYFVGSFFAMLSIFLGHWQKSLTIGGLSAGITSFYGVEFLVVFSNVIKSLPNIIKTALKSWVNKK